MDAAQTKKNSRPLSLGTVIRIPGAKEVMLTFFCYCALEQTSGLWASSYLVLRHGLSADTAAGFASLFFVGITVGRALSGFLTLKFNDIIIHSTPEHFGAEKSQAMIGVQMASAYAGTCLMPPLFGLIANHNRFTFAFLFTVNPGSHGMDA